MYFVSIVFLFHIIRYQLKLCTAIKDKRSILIKSKREERRKCEVVFLYGRNKTEEIISLLRNCMICTVIKFHEKNKLIGTV